MKIIAHRGASFDAPENTVAAAMLGWSQGADAVEVDVQLTRDGQLAVIHDEDTRRVAGSAGLVGDTTLADLRALDVGRWKSAAYAGEKIPALPDVLATVPAGRKIFVELKGGPRLVEALAPALAAAPPAFTIEQLVVIAFELATIRAAKAALPAAAAYWIVDCDAETRHLSPGALADICVHAGLDGLDLGAGWPIDADFARTVAAAGLGLYVWTVDDPARARRLADAGVDGIATNRPGWLREQLKCVTS